MCLWPLPLPSRNKSLTWAATQLSRPTEALRPLYLLYLVEIQFHRCRSTKNTHHDPELALFHVDLLDIPREGVERSIYDADRLALSEGQLGLERSIALDLTSLLQYGAAEDQATVGNQSRKRGPGIMEKIKSIISETPKTLFSIFDQNFSLIYQCKDWNLKLHN